MNDLTITILADFGNLLTHLNIFKTHDHSVSCLICSNKEQKNSFAVKTNTFYPILTSSDLVLLHSGNENKVRQLVFLTATKLTNMELNFKRELKNHLSFQISSRVPLNENFAILVIVIPSSEKKNFDVINHSALYILPASMQILNQSCLYYHNYNLCLQYLVHISMITKQRIRVKDVHQYMPKDIAYLQTGDDENQCLFI